MIWTAKDYQRTAIDELLTKPRAMAWFQPGDGKTSITLAYLCELKAKGLINKVLIVAPLRVSKMTWPDEINKWDNFSHLKYAVLHGNNRDIALNQNADIYVINFEGLAWFLTVKKLVVNNAFSKKKKTKIVCDASKVLKRLDIDMLVIDELSKCKNASALQTKLVHEISKKVKRVVGLTGTPSPNGESDLFSQALCIDLGRCLGDTFYKFRYTYFYSDPYKKHTYYLKDNAKEAIYKAITPIVVQRREQRKEYAIPDLFIEKVFIDLPTDALKKYKQMEDTFLVDYNEGYIKASNAAVKTLKLRQISNGALYTYNTDAQEEAVQRLLDSGGTITPELVRDTVLIHNAKAKALAELVAERDGKPLLVFYNFEHDLELIRKELGDVFVLNKEKNQEEIIKQWNDGNISLMLLHPRSGGHGLNLQLSGADVCWFSPEWSNELNEQGNRRVWRQGNPSASTRVYYLLCNNTIDEHVLNTVNSKATQERKLMDGVAAYIRSL